MKHQGSISTLRILKQMIPKQWTVAAIECFKRSCICNGCFYNTFFTAENQACQMKKAVLKLVRLYGKPKDVREKTIIVEE